MHVFQECPAYGSLRSTFEDAIAFQGRDMRTIMGEAPPLAVANFLHNVWVTRHAALKRLALKRTRGDEDAPARDRI